MCLRLTDSSHNTEDETNKTQNVSSELSAVLCIWAITRLDMMRQNVLNQYSKKKSDDLRQIAEQLWHSERILLVFVCDLVSELKLSSLENDLYDSHTTLTL